MVCRTGGADHARAAHHGELNRGAADASGGAVDEQRAAAPDAELVKRARGRLDGGLAAPQRRGSRALANSLRKKNFPTFVQSPQGDKYYHVLVGPYADQKAVDNARKGLEVAGFKAIVKH